MRRLVRLVLATAAVLSCAAAVPAASAQVPVGGEWCAELGTGSQVVDVLGDSIMEAGSASAPQYRWHAMLDAAFQSDGYGGQVWTGGAIGGSATEDYLRGGRYYGHVEFTDHQPSLVIMNWGINDWYRGTAPSQYRANYQTVINDIRTRSPLSTLLLVHSPWVYDPRSVTEHGEQTPYLAELKRLAADNGVPLLQLEWFFDGDDRADLYTDDQIHHNDRGQVVDYAAIRTQILAMCGRGIL